MYKLLTNPLIHFMTNQVNKSQPLLFREIDKHAIYIGHEVSVLYPTSSSEIGCVSVVHRDNLKEKEIRRTGLASTYSQISIHDTKEPTIKNSKIGDHHESLWASK